MEQSSLSKIAAQLGTFDLDLENGTRDWDDRCRTLFGISHHNAVSFEQDFINGLHPEDRERILNVTQLKSSWILRLAHGRSDPAY